VLSELALKKITIVMNISGTTPDDQLATGVVTLSMTLSNIGTTAAEMPLQDVIAGGIARVDEMIAGIPEINFATTDSLSDFNELVAEAKTEIGAATTVFDAIEISANYLYEIQNFMFEINWLKQSKYYALKDMENNLEEFSFFATAESLLAMNAIYDELKIFIETAISEEEIYLITNEFHNRIDMAFDLDEAKVALWEAQDRAINFLRYYFISLQPYFLSSEDIYSFWSVFDTYEQLIRATTAIEQVEPLYQAGIAAYMALGLSFADTALLRAQFLQDMEDLHDMALGIFGAVEAVDTAYLAYIADINAATNPILLISVYGDAYWDLQDLMTEASIAAALAKLAEIRDEFAAIAWDSSMPLLDELFANYTVMINSCHDFWEPMDYLSQFRTDCENYLNFDPFKLQIAYDIWSLNETFTNNCYTATAESIIAMQAVLDVHIPIIQSSISDMDLNNKFNAALTALDDANVLDPVKLELINAIQEAIRQIQIHLDFLYNFINPEVMNQMEAISEEAIHQLRFATTLPEVTLIYDGWYANIQTLDLTPSGYALRQYKQEMLEELEFLHEFILANIDPLPVDFELHYETYVTGLETVTSILDFHDVVEAFREEFYGLYLNFYREQVLAQALETKNYYYSIIEDWQLGYLENSYLQAVDEVIMAWETWMMDEAFWNFRSYCETLAVDYVKWARLMYMDNIRIYIEGLNETATDASITDMHNIYLDFVTQIYLLNEEWQMQNLAAATYDLVDAAYVPDPIKLALLQAKQDAIAKLHGYCDEYVLWVTIDPTIANEFNNILWNNDELILDAASILEVEAAYNSILGMIQAVPFDIDPNKVEPYRNQVITWLAYRYNDATCILNYNPVDLINAYDGAMGLIGTAVTPLEMYSAYTTCLSLVRTRTLEEYKLQELEYATTDLYEQWLAIAQDAQLPSIEAMWLNVLAGIEMAQNWNEVDDVVYQFHEFCNVTLTIEPLKEAKYYAVYYLQQLIVGREMIATDASLAAMQAELAVQIPLVQAAVDDAAVWNQYWAGEVLIVGLFVLDANKYALLSTINYATERMYAFLDYYFNYLSIDYELYYLLDNICDNTVTLYNLATTIADVDLLYANVWSRLESIDFAVDPDWLASYQVQVVNWLDNEFTMMYGTVLSFPPELQVLYDNAVLAVQTTSDGLVMFNAFMTFKINYYDGLLAEMKIEKLAALADQYNLTHALISDADIAALEAAYVQFLIDVGLHVDLNGLDYTVLAFMDYCSSIPVDPLKLAKAQSIETLTAYVVSLSMTATDASIVDMNNELATRIPLINACTTVEEVNVAYWNASDAIDLLYVNDPVKQALVDAKIAAIGELLGYANFTDDFIALTNVYNDFWTALGLYTADIEAATTLSAVDTLKIDGINALKALEILDAPQVDDFKDVILAEIDNQFLMIGTPTEAQINLHANAQIDIGAMTHPYDMQVAYNQYLVDLAA